MHFKSFIAGAFVGAIVFAIAARLMLNDDPNQPLPSTPAHTPKPPATDLQNTRKNRSSAPTITAQTVRPAPRSALASAPGPIDTGRSEQLSTSRQIELPGVVTPAPITELHKKLLAENPDTNWQSGQAADAHAELEAEAKDDSWAYYMEQSLHQFLAGHPDIPKFVISNIECRTTMCELQAIGYDESTGPAWNAILFEMRQQPWFDFHESGSSSSTIDGSMAIMTTLRR